MGVRRSGIQGGGGASAIDGLLQDLEVGARTFARQPAFLVTVLVTLGLGIGGNVAMFGILESSLFSALPYVEPERLVLGRVSYDGEPGNTVSAPDYFDVREQATSFASLAAFMPFALEATLTGGGGDPERVRSPYASWDLFRTLGVDPLLGRHFLPEEGEPGGAAVAILSHEYWERRFGADPAVLGTTIDLDGAPTTLVGVLPESFRFQIAADLWRPMVRGGPSAQARQFHNFVMLGRLAPGVNARGAQAEVDGINARLAAIYPETNRGKGMILTGLHEALVEGYRTMLFVLAAAVATLLLIACANVTGVLLARGSARGAEMAVRSVMGAPPGRLVRQLMTENLLLAGGATALGLVVAGTLQKGILAFVSLDRLGGVEPGLPLRGTSVAVAVALVTVSLSGLVPALRAARAQPGRELARGGARSGGSREGTRARGALVVAQVALTVVLLTVTGLLVRSYARLQGVDPGFDAEGLLTAETPLPAAKYQDVALRPLLFMEAQRRIGELPGVEAVGMTSHLPIRDPGNNVRVAPLEAWAGDGSSGRVAYQRMVLPGYFQAMGIPLRAGRDVAPTDERQAAAVVVLSESLAGALFPEGGALGRRVGVDVGDLEPWPAEVVGVVGDVAPASLASGRDVTMYFSYLQRSPSSMRLAVRTRGDPSALVAPIREILGELDPDIPLAAVTTMDEVIASSISGRRSLVLVLGAFASMALLVAAVGLYGVLAYGVSRRTREIGVRMALGASVRSVSAAVVADGLRLVGLGLLLGTFASLMATRALEEMLFGIGTADPATYAGVALFFLAVASAACLIPARRAARVDPARAFRSE